MSSTRKQERYCACKKPCVFVIHIQKLSSQLYFTYFPLCTVHDMENKGTVFEMFVLIKIKSSHGDQMHLFSAYPDLSIKIVHHICVGTSGEEPEAEEPYQAWKGGYIRLKAKTAR